MARTIHRRPSIREITMEELGIALSLTLEQELRLRRYTEEVKGLSEKDARNYLLDLMRQVMIKDNVIQHLMKKAL